MPMIEWRPCADEHHAGTLFCKVFISENCRDTLLHVVEAVEEERRVDAQSYESAHVTIFFFAKAWKTYLDLPPS